MVEWIRREVWQDPEYPISGPAYEPSEVYVGVVHYTADDKIEYPIWQYLRNMQRSYVAHKGYSVGYNFAIDQEGLIYELRGFDFRAAANNGDFGQYENINFNRNTCSVLFLVDGADSASEAAAESARGLFKYARQVSRDAGGDWPGVRPQPHKASDHTVCPGAGLSSDIAFGRFDIPLEDDEVVMDPYPQFIRHKDGEAVYICWAGFKSWVPDGATMKVLRERYAPVSVREVSTAEMQSYGPVVGPVPPEGDEMGVPFG